MNMRTAFGGQVAAPEPSRSRGLACPGAAPAPAETPLDEARADRERRSHRAGRLLALAIRADDPDAWGELVIGFLAVLTPRDALGAAHAALRALPAELRRAVVAQAFDRAGMPPAPLLEDPQSLMGEARLWTAAATPDELRAYVLAAFHALPPAERAAFLKHVRRTA